MLMLPFPGWGRGLGWPLSGLKRACSPVGFSLWESWPLGNGPFNCKEGPCSPSQLGRTQLSVTGAGLRLREGVFSGMLPDPEVGLRLGRWGQRRGRKSGWRGFLQLGFCFGTWGPHVPRARGKGGPRTPLTPTDSLSLPLPGRFLQSEEKRLQATYPWLPPFSPQPSCALWLSLAPEPQYFILEVPTLPWGGVG